MLLLVIMSKIEVQEASVL